MLQTWLMGCNEAESMYCSFSRTNWFQLKLVFNDCVVSLSHISTTYLGCRGSSLSLNTLRHCSPHSPPTALPGCTRVFPDQLRYIICPACPLCAPDPSLSWSCLTPRHTKKLFLLGEWLPTDLKWPQTWRYWSSLQLLKQTWAARRPKCSLYPESAWPTVWFT